MDIVSQIKKHHKKTNSVNAAAKKGQCSWATAKKLINSSEKDLAKRGHRKKESKLINDDVIEAIGKIFKEEKEKQVPKKQRYKAPAILKRLKSEGIYHGSLRHLKRTVAKIRKDYNYEDHSFKSFLDLNFENGKYIQIDHGEVEVELNGVRGKGYLFVACVPGAVLRFCQVYLTKASEAWGAFHEDCFHIFNGVFPFCIYDNDSVIFNSRTQKPTQFLNDLESHYGFEAIFCNKASGWEKGAVENAVGYCRRNFLPGIARFDSIYSLNYYLKKCCHEDRQELHYKYKIEKTSLYNNFKNNLLPLPEKKCWEKCEFLKVSSLQTVRHDGYQYSVPEKYVGATIKAFISVSEIKLFFESEMIYEHQRFYFEKIDALIFEHYLDQLSRKPGAYKFAKVVQNTPLTPELEDIKKRLEIRCTEKEATKEFIQILLLKRATDPELFNQAVKMSISFGGITSTAISLIIKQLEIQETIEDCPQELLPEKLMIHKSGDIDLKIYQQLLPEGGFE